MTDHDANIREFLNSLPDVYSAMEEGIDIQTQEEYLDYSHSFGQGELSEEETVKLGRILLSPKTAMEGKKKVLVLLAHLGTITAFRQIESFYKDSDKALKQWAALALQECRMFVESTLTDEAHGYIITGLGGHKDRMRYYFFVLPSSDKPFTQTQKKIIKDEFSLLARNMKCTVEEVDKADRFIGLTALVPMDVAVGTFIETGIKKCNELGDFVFEHYYVTNLAAPNEQEIDEIIEFVRGDGGEPPIVGGVYLDKI